MAFTEDELQTYKIALDAFLEKRRPPKEIRDQVDIAYRIDNQSIQILEIRSVFMQPGKKVEMPVAKATFEKTSNTWKIYWQRSNMKWVSYEPVPAVGRLEEFLQLVDEDQMGCFFEAQRGADPRSTSDNGAIIGELTGRSVAFPDLVSMRSNSGAMDQP